MTTAPPGAPPALTLLTTVVVTAAAVLGVLALRLRAGGRVLVAGGVALMLALHVAGLLTGGSPDVAGVPLLPALQLVTAALVSGAAVAVVRRALSAVDAARDTQEEELRLAELRLARSAERDHELRNGLAGIAGATTLLGRDGRGRPAAAALGSVVASELLRLDGLLRSGAWNAAVAQPVEPSRATRRAYLVAPVLDGLAVLRRSAGTHVVLHVDRDALAVGSPDALAQVVVNLIANAERHAPGSPVRLEAAQRDDRVLVVVGDEGPGIPAEQAQAVFAPGVRDPRRGGQGLGLPVCRRMLAAEGGTISVLPADPARPGCTVVVDLPAAPALDPPTLPLAGRATWRVAL